MSRRCACYVCNDGGACEKEKKRLARIDGKRPPTVKTPEELLADANRAGDMLAIAAMDFAMDQIARGLIVERVRYPNGVSPGDLSPRERELRFAAAHYWYALEEYRKASAK